MLFILKNFKKSIVESLIVVSIVFAIIYSSLDMNEFNNGSTDIIPKDNRYFIDNLFHMLYFSFITTSTIGFGDISPKSSKARFLVCLHLLCIIYISFS